MISTPQSDQVLLSQFEFEGRILPTPSSTELERFLNLANLTACALGPTFDLDVFVPGALRGLVAFDLHVHAQLAVASADPESAWHRHVRSIAKLSHLVIEQTHIQSYPFLPAPETFTLLKSQALFLGSCSAVRQDLSLKTFQSCHGVVAPHNFHINTRPEWMCGRVSALLFDSLLRSPAADHRDPSVPHCQVLLSSLVSCLFQSAVRPADVITRARSSTR